MTLERKRKFLVAMVALVFSFALSLAGIVDGGNWVAVTAAIVGLYGGAEAVEGFAHARKNGGDT